MSEIILGNDISSHQGDVNWDVYKNNSNFVIMKASEGTGFTDPKFARNLAESRRVGLSRGFYHFARPDLGNTVEAEADWFLKVIGPVNEGEMLCLDFEPKWSGDVVGWCKKFLDHVASKLNGYKCLIYLNQSQTQGFDWKPVVDGNYGLWIAAYTYDPRKNNYATGAWKFAAMQQWSNKQTVPGISGVVDANVLFGDINTFKKYAYVKSVIQPPAEQPNPVPEGMMLIKKEDYKTITEQNLELQNTITKLKSDHEAALALKDTELLNKLSAQLKEFIDEIIEKIKNIK